jgi:hypothetical protein
MVARLDDIYTETIKSITFILNRENKHIFMKSDWERIKIPESLPAKNCVEVLDLNELTASDLALLNNSRIRAMVK